MSKFAFEKVEDRIRRQRVIKSPIASDTWVYTDASGRKRRARISVAKPRPVPQDPNGDWYCGVLISGWRKFVIPAFGVGPLDSLANGLQLVKAFQEEIGTAHIIAQGGKPWHTNRHAVRLEPQPRRRARR